MQQKDIRNVPIKPGMMIAYARRIGGYRFNAQIVVGMVHRVTAAGNIVVKLEGGTYATLYGESVADKRTGSKRRNYMIVNLPPEGPKDLT